MVQSAMWTPRRFSQRSDPATCVTPMLARELWSLASRSAIRAGVTTVSNQLELPLKSFQSKY